MNQTSNIIPDTTTSTKTSKALTVEQVVLVIEGMLDDLMPEPSNAYDVDSIADTITQWNADFSGLLIDPRFLEPKAFMHVADMHRMVPCDVKGCTYYGQLVPNDGHAHTRRLATFHELLIEAAIPDAGDEWHIDAYIGNDRYLTSREALELADALRDAADRIDAMNWQSREVRRPTDWAAEPQLDGRGGGL